jgi:hypothetical protein
MVERLPSKQVVELCIKNGARPGAFGYADFLRRPDVIVLLQGIEKLLETAYTQMLVETVRKISFSYSFTGSSSSSGWSYFDGTGKSVSESYLRSLEIIPSQEQQQMGLK